MTLLEIFQIVRENGGEGQNRTVDTTIFSRMLYQLSYLAPVGNVNCSGYSERRASIGSTRTARSAGIADATSVTAPSSSDTVTNVTTSFGPMWNRND